MIKKTNKEFKVLEKNQKSVFTINNSNGDKITVYSKDMVENLYKNRFQEQYKRLVMMVASIDEDASDSDTEMALIRLSDYKETLLNRYAKYISEKELNKYIKKILLLEERLNLPKKNNRSR